MSRSLASSLQRLALSAQSAPIASTSSLRLAAPASRSITFSTRPSPSFAGSFARTYATHSEGAIIIGTLQPNQKPKKKKRLGRGDSSGRGGTSTRGHKGQNARAGNGKPVPAFEGGQTPLQKLIPKRGFTNGFEHTTAPLNLSRLQAWIDAGLIDPSRPITAKELYLTRCVHNLRQGGVKILGNADDRLKQPIDLTVSRASQSAIKAIEGIGGTVTCRFYSPLTLRALVKPEKWLQDGQLPPNNSIPVGQRDLLYYSNIRNRGWLAKMYLNGTLSMLAPEAPAAAVAAAAATAADDTDAQS